jgi:hypothetical protein
MHSISGYISRQCACGFLVGGVNNTRVDIKSWVFASPPLFNTHKQLLVPDLEIYPEKNGTSRYNIDQSVSPKVIQFKLTTYYEYIR